MLGIRRSEQLLSTEQTSDWRDIYQGVIMSVFSQTADTRLLALFFFNFFLIFNFFSARRPAMIGPTGLFWQPALVRLVPLLYKLWFGRIKMLACCLRGKDRKSVLFLTQHPQKVMMEKNICEAQQQQHYSVALSANTVFKVLLQILLKMETMQYSFYLVAGENTRLHQTRYT